MPGKIQFGVFELDRDAMELHKHGVPIRLQEQPLRVLIALTERPGAVVTREELQERIWGKETFVDFEQSLNKAVNRLREALNDEANQPRYIETVPRRGYRFIAPVTGQTALEPIAPTSPQSLVSAVEPSVPRPHRPRIASFAILATVCVLVAVGIAAVLLWQHVENRPVMEARLVTSAASGAPRLSRDGKLLAYTSRDSRGVPHVWIRQTAGGEAIQVTNGPEGEISPDFSPDGTHILFVSGDSIYIKPTFSDEPKLITGGVSAEHPYFSPSGEKICFGGGEKLLAMIVSVDGGETRPIHTNPDLYFTTWPFWSPKGDEVILGGVDKRDPNKLYRWWIVAVASGEATLLDLPDGDAWEGWIRDKDGAEWILYTVEKDELWQLFRIRLKHGQIEGKPEPLVSGTGLFAHGNLSASEDGKLAYFTANYRESVYEIPIGSRGERSGPTLQLPLPDGDAITSPVLSRDGRWMAYDTWRPGKSNTVKLRDLRSGTDRSLDELVGPRERKREITISPDGSKVIFERICKDLKTLNGDTLPCAFLMPVVGGKTEQICDSCSVRGFSSDGSVVLIQRYNRDVFDQPPPRIAAVNLASRTEKEFLSSPDKSLWHAFFSWDDRWVVFKKFEKSRKSQLMIAPVRNGVAGKEPTWIPITDGRHNDDKPQFSPDGGLVYFTSTRDGYRCVWAQKLDPATKRPVGEPVAYEHFHNAAGKDAADSTARVNPNLSVSRDKMVINLPQFSINIWLAQLGDLQGQESVKR
jgi:DNA-binding winged helix-turn-helix (wHTH) protein/dipeptidyl aminopeptidase/acylaminoacyl peptidase